MPAPASYARRQFPGAAADTTITSAINNTDVAVTLSATTGWPTGTYTGGILCELYVITTGNTAEKVWAANLTGSTLTIVRAADGTSATSHDAGTGIRPIAGAIDADEANRAVNETLGQLTAAGQMLISDGAASAAALDVKTSGRIIVGNGTTAASVAVSGDATLSSAGVLTLTADSVGSAEIAANAVGASEIAADAVGASELANNAVDTAAIADLAVTAAKIALDTITAAQVAPNAIGSSELADNAVDTAAIADLAVTAAKIAADTITATQIAANAIGSSELADNAVDTAAIANDAVTPAKMAEVALNSVLEGPLGGGDMVATQRGRSWAAKMEADSVAIDTTPTQVTSLDLDAVNMKGGRRYQLTFSGSLGVTSGSGVAFVGFRRAGTAFSKYLTNTLTSVAFPGNTFVAFYEPAGDEANDWSIWLESNSAAYNVRIKGSATEEACFIIQDIGFATNV